MDIKKYLSQAYRIDQRINSKLEQIISLQTMATKATATIDDIGGKNGTKNSQSMESIIVQMVDLKEEINRDILGLIDIKHKIVRLIKSVVNPELQTLLELRYLCFKTWEQIAVEMDYELRYMHKLHGRALEICSCFLKEDTKRH